MNNLAKYECKVVVCGSRSLDSKLLHPCLLSNLLEDAGDFDVIVSGGAKGADAWAKETAEESSKYAYKEFLPDWDKHGKKAGYIRNITMLEQDGVEHCLALWDGESKGTKHTIDAALSRGIDTTVIFFKKYEGL